MLLSSWIDGADRCDRRCVRRTDRADSEGCEVAPWREEMAKAEATVEELVGMIERGEPRLPEMQRPGPTPDAVMRRDRG